MLINYCQLLTEGRLTCLIIIINIKNVMFEDKQKYNFNTLRTFAVLSC